MDSLFEKYLEDARVPCKYGIKCYQKNPVHLEKYKHPPKKNESREEKEQPRKKIKMDKVVTYDSDSGSDTNHTSSQTLPEKVINNDVSESDEETVNTNGKNNVSESDEETMNTVSSNGKTNVSSSQNKDHILYSGEREGKTGISRISKNDEFDSDAETVKTESSDIKNSCPDSKSGESEIQKTQVHEKSCKYSDESAFIKQHFLTDMPQDFYQFWDFCKKIHPTNPSEALKPIGLSLVGPFDVLAGKFENAKPDCDFLIHWRYYHDPPELQTILKGDDKTGYHIGYFRDSPDEDPVFLVKNEAKKDGILHQMGSNIFAALNIYLEDLKKYGDPFKKMHIGKIQSALKNEVDKFKIDLSKRTPSMIQREKKIVTRTFNKIGLVVPYDRKTEQGYRALALNNKDLNILLTKLQNSKTEEEKAKFLSELQPVLTFASIATDECDFGTGIELGWNIISHGVDCLNFTISRFLELNYGLLKREAFGQIASAHMKNRRTGNNLSVL